jgi:hypothetical protein
MFSTLYPPDTELQAKWAPCSYDPKIDANGFACRTSADCPSGYVCLAPEQVCCNHQDSTSCLPPTGSGGSIPSVGAGGSNGSGGRPGSGGVPGTGGSTNPSCNDARPPTATGSLVVGKDSHDYVTEGVLHGYAWSWVGDRALAATCISPYCGSGGCTPTFAGSALCVAGTVSADSSGRSCVGVEFNLNQELNSSSTVFGATAIPNSITITDYLYGTAAGNAKLRAYMDDANGDHYCVDAGSWNSGKPIRITDFNTECWGPTATAKYATTTTPVKAVGLFVPSDKTTDWTFAFCLTGVTVQ